MKIIKNNVEIDISLDDFLDLLEEDKLDDLLEAENLLEAFEQFEEDDEDEREKDFIPLDDFLKKANNSLKKDVDCTIIDAADVFKTFFIDNSTFNYVLDDGFFVDMSSHKKSDCNDPFHKKEEELSEEDKKVMRIVDRFKHI